MDMRKGDDLMGKNVGELSEIDLKNLIEEYYMGVKTDELIRKYDLNCNSTSIYKYFPPMVFSDFKCEFCGSALVMDRISKTKSKLPISNKFSLNNPLHKVPKNTLILKSNKFLVRST